MAIIFGYDASGNGNNWTANGLSNTPGVGNDSMVDSPTAYGTDTGVGGEVRGNYCVLNTLSRSISTNAPTPTNGNLEYATPAGVNTTGWPFVLGSIGISSGKWYFEVDITGLEADSVAAFGFVQTTIVNDSDNTDQLDKIIGAIIRNDSVSTGLRSAVLGTYVTRDGADATDAVYQIAIDNDLGKLWIGKANTWYASGNPSAGTNEIGTFTSQSLIPLAMLQKSNTTGDSNLRYNFGQRAFAYTAPSGFKALCTQNLPTPTIGATSTTQANDYFNAVLWTGNASYPRTITGVGFQPDLLWIKSRSNAYDNLLMDAIRGTGNLKWISSNLTDAEGTNFNNANVTSLDSDGFTIGTTGGTNILNANTVTNVAWNWKANGAGVTNTDGQITSTVSANTTSGFSIVTYTGNGSANQTVGHGLGVAPAFGILKDRDTNSNNNQWQVFHTGAGDNYAYLSTTAAFTGTAEFYPTSGSSTTVTIGRGVAATTNESGDRFVMYLFADVEGYSKAFSYASNNTSDNAFVYLGFRPRWIMIKSESTGGVNYDWVIYDTARMTYNYIANTELRANLTTTEGGLARNPAIDILSNGFKVRSSAGEIGSSTLYVGMAFAETPFKYSLAR